MLPERWYRDIWLLIITIIILLALGSLHEQTLEIQEGRVVGTQISCGLTQATITANKHVIEGSLLSHYTASQEKALKIFGFGDKKARERKSVIAGHAYILSIQQAVMLFAGNKASGVIQSNGKVNCKELKQLSHVK